MSERVSSLLILLGVVLVIVALWVLSVLAVRWDTRRRGLKPVTRKAWIAASIGLPLFGFFLYLFIHVLHHYFTPSSAAIMEGRSTATVGNLFGRPFDPNKDMSHIFLDQGFQPDSDPASQQFAVAEPAWGKTAPARSNGKAHVEQTPETIQVAYQSLKGMYSLMVVQGPLLGQEFILKTFPLRIGRGSEANIALDADLNVSRKHAEIYEWNGVLRIRDLGSLQGTLINNIPVRDQAINPGDQIKLGGTVLVVHELP